MTADSSTGADERAHERFDVAIVGGGASGVLVAAHLLSRPMPGRRVAIIEPDEVLARGIAYGTTAPEHLLNVTAGRMSAFEDDPRQFVRFLAADGGAAHADDDATASAFMPRREYGRYLRHVLAAQPAYGALRHLRGKVTDLERGDGFVLRLACGGEVRADAVVLAVGNAPRRAALAPPDADARFVSAWDGAAVSSIASDADVCILGSGLSMVDAVVTLARRNHRGRIHVISRHGLMPRPHAAPGRHGDSVADLLELGARGRTRALRRLVADAVAAGQPWQWVFDRLRPHGTALWRAWNDAEQARFLRHLVRFWDVHRHRIAPEVHAVLERLQRCGQMDVLAGRLLDVATAPSGECRIRCRLRATDAIRELTAHRLVTATGIETRLDARADELTRNLLARGLAVPGPHGLGIASGGIGQVLDARGCADPGLFVIGALRIGELWETIAIPDLRIHAARIAEALRGRLAERPSA